MRSGRASENACYGFSSHQTHICRPAGGGVVMPVMMPRGEHERSQHYRFADPEVNLGTEALPSGVRVSFTP